MRTIVQAGRPALVVVLAAVLSALGGLLPLVLAGAPASAAPRADASCSASSGVVVLVQYPDGSSRTGCAGGDPRTGLTALKAAGFAYAFAADTPGFVCTIDGKPADKDCLQADAWGYFVADGREWKPAPKGAKDLDPAPGDAQAWVFGQGKPPRTTPAAARAKVQGSTPARTGDTQDDTGDRSGPAWLWGAGFVVVVVVVGAGVVVARRRS